MNAFSGVSPAASVSPLVNPTRISLTSGEGDVRVPFFKGNPVVGEWPNAARGGGRCGSCSEAGQCRGGGVAVEFVVSPEGICHEPSPTRSSMSLTVCGGSCRLE